MYNQHGSMLTLRTSEGSLSGTFASWVGLTKPGRREAAVVGFSSDNLVSFVAASRAGLAQGVGWPRSGRG